MPLTFNETVPTVTDMLEYCEVTPEAEIHRVIDNDAIADFIIDGPQAPDLNDIVLSDIGVIINNINKHHRISLEKMNEFRKTTNSNYIAWM